MDIAPYIPGKSVTDSGAKAAKLSSNENPLGTSPAAREAFASAAGELERYPDASGAIVREAIAAKYGLDPQRIIYGNGSDEVLHLAAGAFAGPGDEIIFVRYGFAVYEIAARRVGATPVIAPDADYATDVDAILAAVTDHTRVVFVANPNNPTGTYASADEIARLHAGLPAHVLLVLDHAYSEYLENGEEDGGLALAKTASNVLVTRTFSKIHGLAAERIGWGYASMDIVAAMHRIRMPFNMTIAGQRAELGSLRMFAGDLTPEIEGLVTQLQNAGRTIMVVRWGGRFLGALGVMLFSSTALADVAAFDVGSEHACAVNGCEQTVCWGYNDHFGEMQAPAGDFIDVAVGMELASRNNIEMQGMGEQHAPSIVTQQFCPSI